MIMTKKEQAIKQILSMIEYADSLGYWEDGYQIPLEELRDIAKTLDSPTTQEQENGFHWIRTEGGSWLECDCDCEAPDCFSGICDAVKNASYKPPQEQESQEGECHMCYNSGVIPGGVTTDGIQIDNELCSCPKGKLYKAIDRGTPVSPYVVINVMTGGEVSMGFSSLEFAEIHAQKLNNGTGREELG